MRYAVLNAQQECINIINWDGKTPWQPPEGCTVVLNEDNKYHLGYPEQEQLQAPLDEQAQG